MLSNEHDMPGRPLLSVVTTGFYWPVAVTYNGSLLDRLDAEAGRGITRSGRVYQLDGPASHDPDADYVWAVWARLNRVPWFRDVTGDIEAMLKPGNRPGRTA